MRRAFAPLLLALAIVSPLLAQSAATSGQTTRYSRLYVFGDSYSDIGAGYIDGNGPTAVAYHPAYEQFVGQEAAAGLDLWLNRWGAAFDEVMEHPAPHGIVNTTSACAGRTIFDQDPTPVGDPATYFFYHEGHPSTAVHRIVGKRLFEEIAARQPTTNQP